MTEFQAPSPPLLQALVLSDGKMGDLAQCRGVTLALGAQTKEIIVKPSKLAAMLARKGPDAGFQTALENLNTRPDIIIASGRRTAPYLSHAKAYLDDVPLTVFLKDPRTGPQTADIIWVPSHDGLRGPNVVATSTGPHGHTAHKQAVAATALATRDETARLPHPWLGVLLGGSTSKVPYERATVERLVQSVRQASKTAGSVLITPSRRTPLGVLNALRTIHPHTWIWNGTGDNPYPGMLGGCDAFLVTGDSHNMVSEALSTGKQIMVFRPSGLPKKFTAFLDQMDAEGVIFDPAPADFSHQQTPIDATPVIANAVLAALKAK